MRKIFLCLLVFFIVVVSGCSQIRKMYEYTIKFEFENSSDIEIIEKRINALQLIITETEQLDNNVIIYDLSSYCSYSDEILNLLCSDEEISITNKNGDVILERSDVIAVKYVLSNIMVEVSDGFRQEFYDNCIAKTILFNYKHTQLSVEAITEVIEDKSYITFMLSPNSSFNDKLVFVSGAISLCSEAISQNVSMQIVKRVD